MEKVIDSEQLFDDAADFEEEDSPSEDIAELHFRRIQAFPVLSDAEEQDLLQRWCEFKDEKAKDRIIEAHMRMVPPIARAAALKAGFEPNYEMMPTAQRRHAATGFAEVVSDLTAAGNLGLVQALGGYRLGANVKFYTYACGEKFGSRRHFSAAWFGERTAARRRWISALILFYRTFMTSTITLAAARTAYSPRSLTRSPPIGG
jgi:hypothetical protein